MPGEGKHRAINVPGIGEVLLVKRKGARRLRISVSPRRGVAVSMPWLLPYSVAEKFLLSKRQWIMEAIERQTRQIQRAESNGKTASVPEDRRELERMRENARKILVPKLTEAAVKYGFSFKGRVAIKNNTSSGVMLFQRQYKSQHASCPAAGASAGLRHPA